MIFWYFDSFHFVLDNRESNSSRNNSSKSSSSNAVCVSFINECCLDGDLPPPWKDVLHVVKCDGEEDCPVCLHSPSSPIVTRCGHSYCLPCFISYCNYSSQCAICGSHLTIQDAKTVSLIDSAVPSEGEMITLSLVLRRKADIAPYNVPYLKEAINTMSYYYNHRLPYVGSSLYLLSRYSIATKEYIQNILQNNV